MPEKILNYATAGLMNPESFTLNIPYGEKKPSNISAVTVTKGPMVGLYVAGQPMPAIDDDMTYSGPFIGDVLPYVDQANSDGSDPSYQWLDDLAESMLYRTMFVLVCWAGLTIVGMCAGYFVARLNF